MCPPGIRSFFVLAVLLALAAPSAAEVRFDLVVDATELAVDDTVRVDVEVPVTGDAFNGYDAYVTYDPAVFEPLFPVPQSAGEGALFTDACGMRFLDIATELDSARVRVSHVLLCAGTNVAGPGRTYTLRFRALGVNAATSLGLSAATQAYDAGFEISTTVGSSIPITVGTPTDAPARPQRSQLRVYPNPFNPSTTLRIEAEPGTHARLSLYDAVGRHVRTLFDGTLSDADLALRWNGRDAQGRSVASGLYHARLLTTHGTSTARLVLVR